MKFMSSGTLQCVVGVLSAGRSEGLQCLCVHEQADQDEGPRDVRLSISPFLLKRIAGAGQGLRFPILVDGADEVILRTSAASSSYVLLVGWMSIASVYRGLVV